MEEKNHNDQEAQYVEILKSGTEEERMSALESLTMLGSLRGVWEALRNENRAVSHRAIASFIKLKASEQLCHAVKMHDSATVRRASVHALKDIGDLEWIKEAVRTDDLVASFMAMCVLANAGDNAASERLSIEICRDDHVSTFVADAASRIGCGKLAVFIVEKIELALESSKDVDFEVAPHRTTVEHLSRILDKDSDSVSVDTLKRIEELPEHVRFWRVTFRNGKPEGVPICLAKRAAKLRQQREDKP